VALPELARQVGVAALWVKDESHRPLGNFKSLGGVYAGLEALKRRTGAADVESLLAAAAVAKDPLPALFCASDGNHGLAVAAGARIAGTTARVYLPAAVPPLREARIRRRGATIVRVAGTYDDAVAAAAAAAARGEGLLIADTSADPADEVVADVMAGYGVMAAEIVDQLASIPPGQRPTHLLVQAGVGGLAAALASGLINHLEAPARVIVVEPDQAACVTAALTTGQIERFPGALETAAEMLSCGEASAPALRALRMASAIGLPVSEAWLTLAVDVLSKAAGIATTASGATGIAGLLWAQVDGSAARHCGLGPTSRVLAIITEGPVPPDEAADRDVLAPRSILGRPDTEI
jgi:diaminopropionate ammonia-lyase